MRSGRFCEEVFDALKSSGIGADRISGVSSIFVLFFCLTLVCLFFFFFFFFKQKTAYEMCGRDWSSDVCSSDLTLSRGRTIADPGGIGLTGKADQICGTRRTIATGIHRKPRRTSGRIRLLRTEIGRASCRERV